MASYQARGRDPLFDQNTALVLEKRGRELVGIGLMVLGLVVAATLVSHAPTDPSWVAATDAPVQNWLGRPGAFVAAFLLMIVGLGAWAIPVAFLAWGVRLVIHREEDRALWCMIFVPVWVLMASVYAAGLTPGDDWVHDIGLGGLFGEMMMGGFLTALPLPLGFGLKFTQLLLGVGILAMGAFVLGFTRPELRAIARFLIVGLIVTYAQVVRLLGLGAGTALQAAQNARAAQAARREERAASAAEAALYQVPEGHVAPAMPAAPRVRRAPPPVEPQMFEDPEYDIAYAPEPEPAPEPERGGFLSRMPSLIRRVDPDPMPEPELVEELVDYEVEMPGEDRIRAKIARAVKSHRSVGTGPTISFKAPDPEKPLTKGRGHGPKPLIFNAHQRPPMKAEPPLTAAQRTLPPEPPLTAPAPTPPMAEAPAAPVEKRVADWTAPQAQPIPSRPERVIEEDAYAELTEFDDYGDDYDAGAPYVEPAVDYSAEFEDDLPPAPPIHRGGVPIPEPKKVVQQPVRKPLTPSKRAQAEAQPSLKFEDSHADYELPPLSLLMSPDQIERHHLSDEALEENARMLENVLDDYGVKGEIVSVRPGPVVTMYELEPAPGLKASRVIGLADDIARSMEALSARVSTVPGRSVIGIELPNTDREMVCFREILASREYGDGKHALPLVLGKDIGGDPMVANLAKMPHLLIAGTTGSGKSVAINTMILSLLYKLTPDECRLIMIDPKMLELSVYDGIPHLLSPVVTDPKKAVVALKWVVGEMEDRYRKMSKMGVRNIDGYNSRVEDALKKNEMFERTVQTGFDDETGEPVFETEQIEPKKMPYIVVIVDEMADLMMVAGKEIEACIQRLAQMARASGIHLIMATQRPSVDVITGTIKANFPTRISFQVTSKIDSRTILGEMGAEQLLGQGDMLYMAGGAKITRCHGPFVSDMEVEEIVNHLKAFGPPEYVGGVVQGPDDEKADNIDAVLGLNTGGNTNGEDALYDQAVAIVIKDRKCSTSYIQRKLGIGYNKAARLVEQMEDEGVVSPANHVGKREILVPEQA